MYVVIIILLKIIVFCKIKVYYKNKMNNCIFSLECA